MKFNTKINLPSVNQANGKLENSILLKNWKNQYTIETVLQELKKEMTTNKKLPQPAEGTMYWSNELKAYIQLKSIDDLDLIWPCYFNSLIFVISNQFYLSNLMIQRKQGFL